MQIKVEVHWTLKNKLLIRLSCWAPLDSFKNFYHGLKLMVELVTHKYVFQTKLS